MGEIKKIGFVGIGKMGYPMAGHLVTAGFEVTVADADPAAVEKFVAEHDATGADTLCELAEASEAVFTMLPTSKIVRDVVFGAGAGGDCLADGLNEGAIVIDSSSSNPVETRDLGAELTKQGVGMLDAPVAATHTPARDAGPSFRRSRLGCSPSTRPRGPVRRVTASARNPSSTKS